MPDKRVINGPAKLDGSTLRVISLPVAVGLI